jgi:hypothetical protein
MPLGLHRLPLDRGCWRLTMTVLLFLGRTHDDRDLERIGCYLALVAIALGVLQVVFGSCQSNVVRVYNPRRSLVEVGIDTT